MSFQLDGSAAGTMEPSTVGLTRPCLAHRRVNDLELDPVFRAYIELPAFARIARAYHPDREVRGSA
jgi:hypothetical protein